MRGLYWTGLALLAPTMEEGAMSQGMHVISRKQDSDSPQEPPEGMHYLRI